MRRSGIRVLFDRGPRGKLSCAAPGSAPPRTSGDQASKPLPGSGISVSAASGLRVQLDTSTSLRTGAYLGSSYLIVPVVSQVGDTVVWPANAPTPEFIPGDVLQLATESRNGHPVVMGHPRNSATLEYISANDPDTLAKYCFGHVFNARYSDGRVKAEMWISEERAGALPDADLRAQALDAIKRISNGEMVEVSEGNYVVIEDETGTHDGQEYSGRWVLAIPDHLAVLPEGTEGACSVANHGCGAPRVNQGTRSGASPGGRTRTVGDFFAPASAIWATEAPLIDVRVGVDQPNKGTVPQARDGVNLSVSAPSTKEDSPVKSIFSRLLSVFRDGMSNNQLRNRLRKALKEVENEWCHVEDEDPEAGIVVYMTWDWDYNEHVWQRTFSLDANGFPILNDDKRPAEPVMRYEPLPGTSEILEADSAASIAVSESESHNPTVEVESTCSCHKKGDPTPMAFNRKEAIPKIAARHGLDIKVLEAADDTVLEKLNDPNTATSTGADPVEKVKQDKTVPPNTGPDPRPDDRPVSDLVEVPVKETEIKNQSSGLTLEDIQKLLSPITAQLASIAPIVAQAQSAENDRRSTLITSLTAASKFTEDQLKAMSTEHLVTMADSLGVLTPHAPVFDYTGSRVIASAGNAGGNTAPPAPDMMTYIRPNKSNRDQTN